MSKDCLVCSLSLTLQHMLRFFDLKVLSDEIFIPLTVIISADKPITSHTDEGINADTESSPLNSQEVSLARENLSLAANVDRCTKKHPDDISGEDLFYTPPSSPTPLDGVS